MKRNQQKKEEWLKGERPTGKTQSVARKELEEKRGELVKGC